MNEDSKKLIQLLKLKREEAGYSIRKLSSIIDVSFSSLARFERGEGEPDNNSRIKIIDWLGDAATNCDLTIQLVMFVHFRAAKYVSSKTIDCLVTIAKVLQSHCDNKTYIRLNLHHPDSPSIALSKSEMEELAQEFRKDLGLSPNDALDPLLLKIKDVDVYTPHELSRLEIDNKCIEYIMTTEANQWSAMSIPLDENNDKWAILRNTNHSIERQRITFLEECWHILLGHKLTKISKVGNVYGRSFEGQEEHDAYYLAAASLLPHAAVKNFIETNKDKNYFIKKYGVSMELLEYRIKRLGLWRNYKDRTIELSI